MVGLMHKILIIDDHTLMARGLETIFASQPDMNVLGCVNDAQHAKSEVARLQPDVITLDLAMPNLHGSDLIPPLQAEFPDLRIIVLTGLSDPKILYEVFSHTPHAILQKTGDPEAVLHAIRTPFCGTPILCVECKKLFRSLGEIPPIITPLSAREREVVTLLAQGQTTRAAAATLGISEHTVRKHRENSLAKLNAKTTGELVSLSERRGYIP